jgi:hypothetical protein
VCIAEWSFAAPGVEPIGFGRWLAHPVSAAKTADIANTARNDRIITVRPPTF